jgi:hypothetical protein
VRTTLRKRFGPSVSARAETVFHLKDPLLGLNRQRIKSLKDLSDYRAIGPSDRISIGPPQEAFGVAVGEAAGMADFL